MEQIFQQWIGMHRAMIAWYHAAHHVTKGTGFGGDHVNIYGEIYTQLDADLDMIIEKGIGLTGNETLADPVSSLSLAAIKLTQYPSTADQGAETIAQHAFEISKEYIAFIESTYKQFEACGMSLGLDDLLQGLANQYETYVYLLQQRSRGSIKENTVNKRKLKRILREAITYVTGSADDESMANIILTMWDEGLSFDEAVDRAFEGQGLPHPDTQTMKRILMKVEENWGARAEEMSVGGAIDDYLSDYDMY